MDRFYQSLPTLAGFVVSVAPALKPTHEAGRRGGDSIAHGVYHQIFVPIHSQADTLTYLNSIKSAVGSVTKAVTT
jgi:hypothetical protein